MVNPSKRHLNDDGLRPSHWRFAVPRNVLAHGDPEGRQVQLLKLRHPKSDPKKQNHNRTTTSLSTSLSTSLFERVCSRRSLCSNIVRFNTMFLLTCLLDG